jgi:hypothetical protein
MTEGVRLSAQQLRDQAARWRALAAETTTPQTRDHLIKLAQRCEFMASGLMGYTSSIADAERNGAGLADAAQ